MSEQGKFTAVVYYHGVGQQSRYEELSRVLQSFDDFAAIQEDNDLGYLQPKIEASRADGDKANVGYVSIPYQGRDYRFYEVYWAPLTITGTTGWEVFIWLMKHLFTPFGIIFSKWTEHQRWRRSYLYSLWDEKHKDEAILPLRVLLNQYNTFCEKALRGTKLKGTYDEFIDFLKSNNVDQKVIDLGYQWKKFEDSKERLNLFVFLTLGYVTVILPLLTIGRTVGLLIRDQSLENFLPNDMLHAALYIALVALALPVPSLIAKFLKDYGGDVQLWATYEETDDKYEKREKILNRSLDTMTHVLNHEDCDRVIVVAHSLGSTIAYDTLLSIGRHNQVIDEQLPPAKQVPSGVQKLRIGKDQSFMPLSQGIGGGTPTPTELGDASKLRLDTEKIEYFITMASPIDKIHYLFESRRGLYRPFERIIDSLRGDMGGEPFVKPDGIPNFRWLNFWQQEDYVSGPLYTPAHRELTNTESAVNNILVQSHQFPAPARAHTGYFRHHDVIQILYKIIFRPEDDAPLGNLREMVQGEHQLRRQRFRNAMLIATWSLLLAVFIGLGRE